MDKDEISGTGVRLFAAALALAGLLLPAAAALLLAVSGLAPGLMPRAHGSWAALAAGMMMGGFGLCTAPLGLPLVLKLLLVPANLARAISGGFASAVVWSASLLGLTFYAWRSMPAPYASAVGDAGLWTAFGALALAAGAAVRLTLEFGRFRRNLGLGAVSLDKEEVRCAPGERAAVLLKTGKKALSVSARLKLFNSEAEVLASREAEVSGPAPAEGGVSYRISWTVPPDVQVPEGGSWELVVEARGRGGAVAWESAMVKPRG